MHAEIDALVVVDVGQRGIRSRPSLFFEPDWSTANFLPHEVVRAKLVDVDAVASPRIAGNTSSTPSPSKSADTSVWPSLSVSSITVRLPHVSPLPV